MPTLSVLVLPGLDGTGTLLEPFITALPSGMRPIIVRYPGGATLDYDALVRIAMDAIPDNDPFLLVAESFSGPIAIRIAAMRPPGLVGIVFCASFACAPQLPLVRLPATLRSTVARRLPIRLVPVRLLAAVMMGRWATPWWRARLAVTLRSVTSTVLHHRLQLVLHVDDREMLRGVNVPILCLRARRDRVVSTQSADDIATFASDVVIEDIDAPHFLLQAKPEQSAARIMKWIEERGVG